MRRRGSQRSCGRRHPEGVEGKHEKDFQKARVNSGGRWKVLKYVLYFDSWTISVDLDEQGLGK